MHGLDDVELGQAGVGDLPVEQAAGDDADRLAAGGQHGVGELAHQAHARTAVDEPDPARREQLAQLTGGREIGGPRAGRRAAEHADPHRGRA